MGGGPVILEDEHQTVRAPKIEMIVDRSGSMSPLLPATVSGLNEFMDTQRAHLADSASATIRLHVFDEKVETRWSEGTRLMSAPRITEADVMPRGTTALLDAIGMTLGPLPSDEPRIVCIVRIQSMITCAYMHSRYVHRGTCMHQHINMTLGWGSTRNQ